MHISLLTFILFKILKKICKKELLNIIAISLFLIFYLFLTNYSPSILRATLLFIFISLKNHFKINISNLEILKIIFFGLLLYNPYYIYNTGFSFSFLISYALIKNNILINKYNNYFIKLLIISLISFIYSIPIISININQINILSIIYNILFVPFISFVIFPLTLINFFIPYFDNILSFFINILETLSYFFYNINLIIILSTNYIFIFIYLIILNNIFKNIRIYKVVLFILIIFLHSNIKLFDNSYKITTLDIGQGDSILIEVHNNKSNILLDTGGSYNKSLALNTLIPYFKSIGISKLNYLILTHGDFDHMGEAIDLVENFKVEKVIFNCGEFNDLEQELVKVLNKKKIPYYSCISELNINNNKLYFLQTDLYNNENDNSNVIYTELNGYKFMFMGDAGVDKEKDILDKYNISNIDVLKVGHHGSRTSSGEDFINKIDPKYSVISVGKNNRYGHPNKEVLNNLDNSKIYRTDQDGSIMIKINNNKLNIETCSP